MKQLFQEVENEDGSNTELAAVTMRIMQALQSNLEGKSKQYKDPALSSLFIMNNIHYMVRSVCKFGLCAFCYVNCCTDLDSDLILLQGSAFVFSCF